jgi:2-iminoacetate synthase
MLRRGCYAVVLHGVLMGRTGQDFMDLAKPGKIKDHCDVNALSTFMEYLIDYASPETRAVGEKRIAEALAGMTEQRSALSKSLIAQVKEGKRDAFV